MNRHTGISLDQFMMEQDLEDQTINFWNIQLFLFNLDYESLAIIFLLISRSPLYVENKYTAKMIRLSYGVMASADIEEKDIECLATHIALQMAAINE